jgi:cell wall assembly regulator SMI1
MTDTTIERCKATLLQLYLFSENILDLGDPITDNRLQDFESDLGFALPQDFKYIISRHNYISLGGQEIYGLGSEFNASSLDQIYNIEHEGVANPMPKELLPFAPDGYGNHYCLDLSSLKEGISPVLFWQHECIYKSKDEVEVCDQTFTEWIDEVMINWTLADTNYDGTPKDG